MLLAGAAAAAFALLLVAAWRTGLLQRLSDYDQVVEIMRSGGSRAALVCMAVQFVQVVIFVIPGEITQIAAGYVFGAWKGFVYSLAGIAIGSAAAFGLGRLAGRPLVERMLGPAAVERIDSTLCSSRGRTALFLLFLLPGAPKDAMSYGAGVSGFPIAQFVLITGLARAPGLLFSTLFGAQVYQRDYRAMALIALAAVAVIGVFWFYQRRITGS